MPTDFHADLVASIAATLDAHLSAAGAEDPAQLELPRDAAHGDLAMACHRYARVFRKAPQAIATDLAQVALAHPMVRRAEPINGFLNLALDWTELASEVVSWAAQDAGAIGQSDALADLHYLIEYSAPNTNKPQHLGHCRNNLLGHIVGTLLETAGARVTRVNLINDRGIHICKSMVAYTRWGQGATPDSTGTKGDHFVGGFYVRFASALREEYQAAFPDGGGPGEDAWFNGDSPLGQETRAVLQAWEAGDPDTMALWRTMNGWCLDGFTQTYDRMGVRFDLVQKESETYLRGKRLVEEGLESGVFERLDNGAVGFDLARIGREGHKIVLRADGTSLYVTQDLGTALLRHEELAPDRLVYVVGNEQDYYFKVLFEILGEIEPALKGHMTHRSYGMVELPDGKMKSREGTVVDADDVMDEQRAMVLAENAERWADLEPAERQQRAEEIGMAGLRYFLMRFNPDRTFVFDKEASIKIEGDTGPYCQYAHARCAAILRNLPDNDAAPDWSALDNAVSIRVMGELLGFPGAVRRSAVEMDPSLVTKALYGVAKAFASFYAAPEGRVIDAAPAEAAARAALVAATQRVLAAGLGLLGMAAVDEM